jgi:hypothetical protein
MGLALTRGRLAELYGDAQSLSVTRSPAGGTESRVTLPLHTAADVRIAAEVGSAMSDA